MLPSVEGKEHVAFQLRGSVSPGWEGSAEVDLRTQIHAQKIQRHYYFQKTVEEKSTLNIGLFQRFASNTNLHTCLLSAWSIFRFEVVRNSQLIQRRYENLLKCNRR